MSGESDVYHAIGYEENQQHFGQKKDPSFKEALEPQAGVHGEEGSRVCGQSGAELLGGSASVRILGQSVGDQLKKLLPAKSEQ